MGYYVTMQAQSSIQSMKVQPNPAVLESVLTSISQIRSIYHIKRLVHVTVRAEGVNCLQASDPVDSCL